MEAEDWLKGIEKKLVITQCTYHEKVFFGYTPALWDGSKLVRDVLQYSRRRQFNYVE
jgi:hypothetical protein